VCGAWDCHAVRNCDAIEIADGGEALLLKRLSIRDMIELFGREHREILSVLLLMALVMLFGVVIITGRYSRKIELPGALQFYLCGFLSFHSE
jgi:hypothetical protein